METTNDEALQCIKEKITLTGKEYSFISFNGDVSAVFENGEIVHFSELIADFCNQKLSEQQAAHEMELNRAANTTSIFCKVKT